MDQASVRSTLQRQGSFSHSRGLNQHQTEDAFFGRLGYIDIQWMAERLRNPVRMYTGLCDTICPPSTQFAVYNKIAAPTELVVYPDFTHEELPRAWDDILLLLLKDAQEA